MAPYTLYTAGTPNGWKPSIALEELGLQYDVKVLDFSKNEQKEEWYLKINPNGRIPSLVDHEAGDLAIFESGAILWYLAVKHPEGGLWPQELSKQAEVMSWLTFQMGGIGPMQGQAAHFLCYAPEKIEYGINRYISETKRLYGVLESRLKDNGFLAAGQYTIADIANFTWVAGHQYTGISLKEFPNVQAWVERIYKRAAVKKGLDVPSPSPITAGLSDPAKAEELVQEALKNAEKKA